MPPYGTVGSTYLGGNRGCRGRMWASAPTRNSLCLADEEHADGAGAAVAGDGTPGGGDGSPPQLQILSTCVQVGGLDSELPNFP